MARSLMGNYEETQHQCQHQNLYDKAQSEVLINGSTGEWFKTTVGVRQGCLLSPTLFNIFLERIICEALDEGSASIGRRLITNFRFADDIVVNAEEEEEAGVLIDRLDRTTTRYKMEIGDKTKMMTNNTNGFQREIKIKGQKLEEVENFKYLGAIISNEGSKPEILSRIAQTTTALSRLKIIWKDKNISLASKVKLMRTLILSTFLYACKSWTLAAEIDRRIQTLEISCYRRLTTYLGKSCSFGLLRVPFVNCRQFMYLVISLLVLRAGWGIWLYQFLIIAYHFILNISYKDRVTNEEVRNRI